jgi:hypothetical protein
MSNPSFVAQTTGPEPNGTSITVTLPTGFNSSGNCTIVSAVQTGNGTDNPSNTLSLPSGWTTLVQYPGFIVGYRMWQSGDPSSITLTSTASNWWEANAVTYSGVDATNPIDAAFGYTAVNSDPNHSAGKNIILPSLNPSYSGGMMVGVMAKNTSSSGATFTLPSGFTSRASVNAGPAICTFDQVRTPTDGTPTGYFLGQCSAVTTWYGAMVLLHGSGNAPVTQQAGQPVLIGLQNFDGGAASSAAVPVAGPLNLKTGDLVLVFIDLPSGGTITPPSGWTQAANQGSAYLFEHSYTSGDTDPTFTFNGTYYYHVRTLAFRKSNGSSNPAVDQSETASGTAAVTLAGMTPANSNEFLACFWGLASGSSESWTSEPSGSINVEIVDTWGPTGIFAWTQPGASPTGSFSAQNAASSSTLQAIGVLVKAGTTSGGGSVSGTIAQTLDLFSQLALGPTSSSGVEASSLFLVLP